MTSVFPDFTAEADEVRDLGDVTIVRGRLRGHGIESDAAFEQRYWQTVKWRDEQCISWHIFRSEAEALEAAGLSEQAMSEENVEVVKAAFARSSRGDFDGLLALFHPGVEWVEDPHVPGAVTHRGHAEVRRYFESMPRYGEELRFEPERFVDYGDEVLALARVTTRARRGGPEIDRPFDAIFMVRDGKIVRGRLFSTRHDALDAAGLSEQAMSRENVEIVRQLFPASAGRRRDSPGPGGRTTREHAHRGGLFRSAAT